MNPERWQQVKEIFGAALEREPGARAAFLEEACAGDEGLRREVESLLASDGEQTGLLGEPLAGLAAELLDSRTGTHAGRTFGHYEAEREIGRGGMGEVYLARDARLGRPVALKLLSGAFTADADRVARFEQEARAASALNHPNIVTVHEVGEADGLRFIVNEYVEGETLRDLLARGPLPPARALDIALQVAAALAAAHEAGIVHRDIKPENVMVRPDGHVKVLDFGLAKVTGPAPGGSGGGDAATLLKLSTQPGLLMGTVTYMSPEQARGLKVDARTDVWSLGVVLYEMLAGRAPFGGETPSDVLAAILSKEPKPLAESAPDAPEETLRVVSKALSKDKEGRYASMREMLAELREARDEVTFRARQELHTSTGGAASHAGPFVASQSRAGRRRGGALVWAALFIVAASVLTFGVYEYLRGRRAPPSPPSVKMERITAHGKISQVAISRDGKYVAYVTGPTQGQHGVWVMQTGTRSHTQLVPPDSETAYLGLTFSPEGDYVYLSVVKTKTAWLGELYRVPTLGGTPKRLLSNIDSSVTFSPDGRQIAFVRNVLEGKPLAETRLVVANADGTGERVVATRRQPEYFWAWGVVKISWSPDGEVIACPEGSTGLEYGSSIGVVGVNANDGAQRPLTRQRWARVTQVEWLGDGSGLVMSASEQPQAPAQLWHVSYPGGEAHSLTNDLNNYSAVSVTADSSTIAAVQGDLLSNIWVAPGGEAARARQITDNRYDGLQGFSWTPDGRLVYSSYVSGNADIWVMDADGGNRRRLTEYAGFDGSPSVSGDGRYIVYLSYHDGRQNVWRMDIDGGHPVRLTDGNNYFYPHCSPDGRSVYYVSLEEGGGGVGPLWRVPIEGGDPVLLVDGTTANPIVSPDQKFLAYLQFDPQANPQAGMAIVPVGGGPPVKRIEVTTYTPYSWTPDGRAIAYLDDRGLNVWARPLDGGPPRQLTDFKTDQTFFFDFSRDGKQIALARGTVTSDVVLITDFK